MNRLKTNAAALITVLPILFFACQQEPKITKIYGQVLDIEQGKPVANVAVDLVIGDQLGNRHDITNPVKASTTTNNKGEYSFELPYKESQQLFWVNPKMRGYVAVRDGYNDLPVELNKNGNNHYDINIAKATYLKISISKTSPPYPVKHMELKVQTIQDAQYSPLNGQRILTEKINFYDRQIDTTIWRGYFHKQVKTVNLAWYTSVNTINNGTYEYVQNIALQEHDTVSFEISY